ncbi:RES domain-containing protein [Silvibacterium bohemicum]|uniref:RES domain-containing protein n=1 Tax=Silvibacterium bohemicum TaxID=1577686 RepID=A0A841JWK2_9BACT|nr:RES family NAD+ phosphorylase [Silvibacterium bohemicum]MBB6145530.1 RES domain-containing protein [Silvibacterium bohemicum]
MELPPVIEVRLRNTHRLIPSKFSEGGTVLSRIAENQSVLNDLLELDSATNDRLQGEQGLLPGISVHELVYGVDYAHIVNAAFTHASPEGGRFNGPQRGAWYAGLARETALAEVGFHKQRQLEEVNWAEVETSTFDDYLADFTMPVHDITGENPRFKKYLRPEPIPDCYAEPQALTQQLLAARSNGVLYPSVRQAQGNCLACFRPALVYFVRRGARLEMAIQAGVRFSPRQAREIEVAE